MRSPCYTLFASLWKRHEESPLSANEVALYLFLLDIGGKSGWAMPMRLHNSEVCPMLMEKSALEKARKKLQDKGLITYTASRSPRHLPTYAIIGCETGGSASKTVSRDERVMTGMLARMWQAFDERALNASEVALFSYLLREAERSHWQMPVRIKDYMPLTLLLKQGTLNAARTELAARSLISFDAGDGKRDVPKYTLLDMESIVLSSSDGKSRPKPKSSKKNSESAAEAETAGAAALDEEDVSSVIGPENATVSDDDSQALANQPLCDGGKQLDLFGMTICDTSDESWD